MHLDEPADHPDAPQWVSRPSREKPSVSDRHLRTASPASFPSG